MNNILKKISTKFITNKLLIVCCAIFFCVAATNAQLTVLTVNKDPYCIGSSTGSIKLTASASTAPYTVQMTSPTLGAVTAMPGDVYTYTGLNANSYQFKITDANGNFQSRTIVLANPAPVSYFTGGNYAIMTNVCDSIDYTPNIYITGTQRPNYKFEFWINSSTPTGSPTITYSSVSNLGMVMRIPMGTFGTNSVMRMTDSCGNVAALHTFTTANITTVSTPSKTVCNATDMQVEFQGLLAPITFNLYAGNTASGAVLQSHVQSSITRYGSTPYQDGGLFTNLTSGNYTIVATDACGKTYTKTVTFSTITKSIPSAAASNYCQGTSVDSTTSFRIGSSTWSTPYTFTIVSGPSTYNHANIAGIINPNITYPMSITSSNKNFIELTNMPMGTYRIAVIDSCGWTDTVTYVIDASNIVKINMTGTVTPGCLNANSLTVNVAASCTRPEQRVHLLSSAGADLGSAGLTSNNTSFTVNNLPAGNYYFALYGISTGAFISGGTSILQHVTTPVSMKVPFTINPYVQPSVSGILVAPCINTTVGSLIATPQNGVPPYTYELLAASPSNTILAGPQTSDTFSGLATNNIYRIRVTDLCGNASVSSNVSLNTLNTTFTATASPSNCVAGGTTVSLTADTLNATTYSWTGPNGFTKTGRIVTIPNATAANAGTYTVTATTVGSCVNTATVVVGVKPDAGTDITGVCSGTSATLIGSPSGGIWTAETTNAALYSVSGNTVTFTSAASGTYNFAYSLNGCTDTVAVTVASCGLSINNVCPSSTANLTTHVDSTTKPLGTIVSWHTGTPATDANRVATPTAVAAGTYYASYWDVLVGCYSPASASITVVITPCCPATVPAITPTSVATCSGSSVSLLGLAITSTAGAGERLVFSTHYPALNNNDTLTTAQANAVYSAGMYYAYYRNAYCLGPVDSVQVVLLPKPEAGTDKSICYMNGLGAVTLSGVGSGVWYAPNSNPGTSIVTSPISATTTVTNFSVVGTYSYIYVRGGCTDTMQVVVTPNGNVGNYVWNDTNGDGIFNESTTNGLNGILVELWDATTHTLVSSTTTGTNSLTGNPGYYNFVICNDGNYQVKFPVTVGGNALTIQTPTPGVDGNSDAVVTTGYSPVFTISTTGTGVLKDNYTIDAGYIVPATTSCNMTASIGVNNLVQCVSNNSYQFSSSVTGGVGPYTYNWDFNDGTYGTTANPTHVYASYGEHDVTLIVKDSRGCEAHASTVQIYIGAKPDGSFAIYPNTGTGTGVTFNSTSTIGNGWMTYQWNLGNGTTSTLSNPGPIYYSPGTYTVTMIVIGNIANGIACSDTVTKTINVNANGTICIAPSTSFTASAASGCLSGNSFSFSSTSINASSYSWNFGDGSSLSTTASASHSYTSSGTYTVTLTATNSCGSSSASQTIVVNNLPSSPASITGPTSVAVGGVVGLSDATTGGVWSSSNTAVATINNYGIVTGIAAGSTTISYTVTNGCGTSSVSYVVTVTGSSSSCVAPTANFTVNTSNQCLATNAYIFTNSTTGTSPTYSWDFGDGSTVSTVNGTHTYSVAGTYNVKLDVTNACGSSSITKTVVISDVPSQPVSISGTTSVLVGSTTALSSATTGGVWSSNNTLVATVNSATGLVTGIANGTATITYTVSNACGSASRSISVSVSTPVVPCTLPSTPAAITGTTTLTAGATVSLSSATTGGVWSSGNTGVATINASTGLLNAVGAGTATISYTVTNSCGSASVTTLVTVNSACITPVANFTVNNATQCINSNSFVFSNTTTGAVDSYTWNFGDGSSTATSPTHTYASAGTYTVTLQASSACGGSSKTTTVTVQSGSTTPAAIGGTPSVPVGSTTSLTSSTVGGAWSSSNTAIATVNSTTGVVTGVAAGTATIRYTVNNGCGSASTSLLVTVTVPCGAATTSTTTASICEGTGYSFNGGYYTVAGTYVAHLTNAGGCDSAASLVLTVNPLPAQPSAVTGTTSILVGGTTTLSSTPSGGVWSSSNTSVATVNASTGVVTGIATGSTAITYTLTNGCGSRSASTTVTVGTPVVVVPPTPSCNLVAGFTINNNRQCVTDNQFIFTNTTTGGTAPFTYLWDLNDGTYASTQNVTKTYATYGEHDVTLRVTDANGCISHSTAQQLYVGAKPHASFSILTNTGSGSSTTFISSSTVALGTLSYLWDLGNGQTSTAVNPTTNYTPAPSTPYTIKLIVSGWGTCKDTAIQTYTQYAIASVSVYPNPVMDAIQVSFRAASATPTTVKIMDLAGRVLQIQTVTPISSGSNVTATLDTHGLQSGSYIVHISDVQNGFLATKAILKQ